MTMRVLLPFLVGGLLLCAVVGWKLREILHILQPGLTLRARIRAVAWLIVGMVAVGTLVDPMIAGRAALTVDAPTRFPTTRDNLRVRMVPLGFGGYAGGDRTVYSAFDASGVAEVSVDMEPFETWLKAEVIDQLEPTKVVAVRQIYVSPFVRRQWSKGSVVF